MPAPVPLAMRLHPLPLSVVFFCVLLDGGVSLPLLVLFLTNTELPVVETGAGMFAMVGLPTSLLDGFLFLVGEGKMPLFLPRAVLVWW